MKVNIEGIRKLKDGTVSASITTSKANYLPLVMLDEESRNDSKEIHLTLAVEEVKESVFWIFMRDMIAKFEREAYERGLQDATQGNLLTERGEGNE